MSLFSTECSHCGSKEHASVDCPHGILSANKCKYCGSVDHASSDCPHGVFSSNKCKHCGSTEHASSDCPHGLFSSNKCKHCGSTEHASSECPHSIFSANKCKHCGSTNHSSTECPHGFFGNNSTNRPSSTSTSSSSNNNGCAGIIGWLIGAAVVAFVVIWLAVNVVLPIALLNSALALTILALAIKRFRTLFAILAYVGGCYMLLDITNGWFSLVFVKNVVKDPIWISIFVYINTIAVGLSTWFLVRPIWKQAKLIESTDKGKSILFMSIAILLIAIAASSAPIIYHFMENPIKNNWMGGNSNSSDGNSLNQGGSSTNNNTVNNNNTVGETSNNNSYSQCRYPQASERLLTPSDLSSMNKEDLRIMRNEIFARHGYIFKTVDMKSYFAKQSWYRGNYNDVSSMLTSIEKSNIELIKRYE